MTKVIKQYKTIHAASRDKFDSLVNNHLELGWQLLENSFTISPNYDSETEVYNQVCIWYDDENISINFFNNGKIASRGTIINDKKMDYGFTGTIMGINQKSVFMKIIF